MPGPDRTPASQPQRPAQAGCLGIIARLIWIAAGNFVLLISLAFIVQKRTFSSLDIVYWAVVAALLFIRYADIRWLHGTGDDSGPATMRDWVKYARLLVIISGCGWAVVHFLMWLSRR